MKTYEIVMTTDRQHIGRSLTEDGGVYTMPTGEAFQPTGFEVLSDGTVEVWNSNYVITAREVGA